MPHPEEAAAIKAAADRLSATHFDGTGCGTVGLTACSRCYGPSPASAHEAAEEAIAAAYPIIAAAARKAALAEAAEAIERQFDVNAQGTRAGGMAHAIVLVRSLTTTTEETGDPDDQASHPRLG